MYFFWQSIMEITCTQSVALTDIFNVKYSSPPSKYTPLSTVPALGNSLIVFINIYYCDWTKNDVYIRIIRIDNLLAGVFYERIEQINLFDWLRKYYILDDVLGIVIIVWRYTHETKYINIHNHGKVCKRNHA